MKEIYLDHYNRYPKMQLQDWYKLIYQCEFGNAHMTSDSKLSMKRMLEEISNNKKTLDNRIQKKDHRPSTIDIGGGFCRVDLISMDELDISLDLLNKILIGSRSKSKGSWEGFWNKLSMLEEIIYSLDKTVTKEDFVSYEKDYVDKGCPLLSHSESYKQAYHPSYRVAANDYMDKITLWKTVDILYKHAIDHDSVTVIAIDGMAGAGKSYVSQLFSDLFECNIIQMDDFFPQAHQRGQASFTAIGGNLDHERFEQEIVGNIKGGDPFMYHAYDCVTNEMSVKKTNKSHLNIVEGSYSMHPFYTGMYDLRVFVQTQEDTQMQRIIQRNGESAAEVFKNKWIPLENQYFNTYCIKQNADFIITT